MELFFYTRPNCPLCDRLEELLESHLPEGVSLTHRNILDNRAWYDLYWDRIPVVTHDGAVIIEGNPRDEAVAISITQLRDTFA